MKRFCCRLIVFLLLLEAVGWVLLARQRFWYGEACARMTRAPVRHIFIGSSRVAQAISEAAFSRELNLPRDSALNLGRGHSTMAEHFFGLRRLADASPNRLQSSVVFLEAPLGLPDLSTWTDPWFQVENPNLLSSTIGLSDLPPFWSVSGGSFEQKLTVTLGRLSSVAALRGSWYFYARAGWHALQRARGRGERDDRELTDAGGVQVGRGSFAAARRLAEGQTRQALQHQSLLSRQRLEHSILLSMASFVEREGGRFIVFSMPLSDVQKRVFTTEVGRRNRDLAVAALAASGIPVLETALPTTDEDFPDAWHLRQSRAPEFSRAVAKAYLAWLRQETRPPAYRP